ncbi:MAG: aspartate aminotransferase family protein [Acidobacteria bacterium]|nr:aspartate aminotransferase family protein [Acidobacteriota bacterium]MBI3427375.1 aspartate aminotransferase family protein [Acidobacteriota bacterium]
MDYQDLLKRTTELALDYLATLPERPVGRPVSYAELLEALGGALPAEGADARAVIEQFAAAATPGLVATPGPRYFGFVIGGAHPASLAAEWLAAAWDQNAFSYVLSPAAAVVEEVVRTWLVDLFGLSPEMSLGFTTGGTMANFTALAAARHALLRDAGWHVEEQGLFGAPSITVVTSAESHVSIFAALQMLGLGRERVSRVVTDEQGRMRPAELAAVLAQVTTPVLVCAQAGNVNPGAFDPLPEIVPLVRARKGWLHVDGAFGLWAAAAPGLRHLTEGIELADSLSVDCHKWLNVPYDSGLVFVRDRAAHHEAMTLSAPYYALSTEVARDNHNFVPEASRRARGFAIYAALRALGRNGVAELVDRCCRLARRMAERLAQDSSVQILNDVVLNQVLVRFLPNAGGDADAFTAAVIQRIQADGTCWAGGTTWHGLHAMRIAVSNWSTTENDIDRSAEAMLKCVRAAGGIA